MFQAIKDSLYVNPQQSHRLVTHEDAKFAHAHKILGVLCLSHFFYRMYQFATQGPQFFDKSLYTLGWIVMHAGLHVSSFEFILPSRRNKTYNTIWPEMRWHSLIFAYRSIAAMTVLWAQANGYINDHITMYLRSFIVIATMLAADYTTQHYKKKGAVDAKDSTMRGNPYPSYVSPRFAKVLNLFYSTSQAFATMVILSRGSESVFWLLLPIQTAPFLMTLEKKGIINQAGWHFWYTLAIAFTYVYNMKLPDECVLLETYRWLTLLFCVGRFYCNMNKYFLWSSLIAVMLIYNPLKCLEHNGIEYVNTCSL